MTMMKPNNGQLQSPPGQRMNVYKLACQSLLCEGKKRTAVQLQGKLKTRQRKPVLEDAEIGEICKHVRATASAGT